jgi:predicted ATPase
VERALAVIGEAKASVARTGEGWWTAEIHRLHGDMHLARSANAHAEAEACFRRALDIARKQEAKSLELRAATSLGRLWQSQGKSREAYDLLAPVYGWFTEGFDTVDLKEARALLHELQPRIDVEG